VNHQDLYLKALDHIQKGEWHNAHDIIETMDTDTAAWIHALLHRIEGDQWNANYWYQRAGKSRPAITTDQECAAIIDALTASD